jgi:hypothetical protein
MFQYQSNANLSQDAHESFLGFQLFRSGNRGDFGAYLPSYLAKRVEIDGCKSST